MPQIVCRQTGPSGGQFGKRNEPQKAEKSKAKGKEKEKVVRVTRIDRALAMERS